MVIPLTHIGPGEQGRIVWIASDEPMSGRLRGLGFMPDTHISCVLKGSDGAMAAYRVRNTVIALRPSCASEIFVSKLPSGLRQRHETGQED